MKSFLQSKKWADFQKSLNRKNWRIQDVNIIKIDLPLNKNYLYSPRCGDDFLSISFLDEVKKLARQENSIFLKIELGIAVDEKKLQELGFTESKQIQPNKTLILDISKSEKELLNEMHQKTRYNIRLAEKKGIVIEKSKKSFEDFWELVQKTTKRDNFKPHPKRYYRKIMHVPGIELFIAKYDNKVVAANIILFYKGTAFYLHGASDYKYRNLMAPHLLQWHQVLEAKKQGCNKYDFWGIDSKKWPGVTRFKKGFNGKEITYFGAYDLVFNSFWYKIYNIARKIL